MTYLVVCVVALLASALTFFSGFGLGTLLLPAFALFVPVELAVAMTGVVHFLNGLFKLALVRKYADYPAVIRFGAPAFAASLLGAMLLVHLADLPPVASYVLAGRTFPIEPVQLVVGALLLVFASLEFSARFQQLSFGPRWMPLGGLLSGFFGGLSGMQGALRSAFLIRSGLSKEQFVGTGVVIAVLIDLSRLGVYVPSLLATTRRIDYALLGAAVLSAFAGAWLGNRHLRKVTLRQVQRLVALLLGIVGISLVFGWL